MGKGGRGGGGRQSSTEGPPIISVFNNIKSLARGGGGGGSAGRGTPDKQLCQLGVTWGGISRRNKKNKKTRRSIHDS